MLVQLILSFFLTPIYSTEVVALESWLSQTLP